MKIDKYVKFLLTVMTVCLVLIVGKMYDFVSPAQAGTASPAAVFDTQQTHAVAVHIVGGVGYDESDDRWNVVVRRNLDK